jgi:hypothetical protein
MHGKKDNGDAQREGGRRSWAKHGRNICPLCGNIVVSDSWRGRAYRGGLNSYLTSLQPGQSSMSERGKYGGRPRAVTINDIERR